MTHVKKVFFGGFIQGSHGSHGLNNHRVTRGFFFFGPEDLEIASMFKENLISNSKGILLLMAEISFPTTWDGAETL